MKENNQVANFPISTFYTDTFFCLLRMTECCLYGEEEGFEYIDEEADADNNTSDARERNHAM